MAVQPDLAFGDAADRLVVELRGVDLPAAVAADIRIDSRLQPHRVEPIGQRAKAGKVRVLLAARRRAGRGKLRGADDHAPVRGAPLQPPAIVDIDVAIPHSRQPGIDERLCGGDDLLLVDGAVERVPTVPAHRWHGGLPLLVRAPAAGGVERIGSRKRGYQRRRQQRGEREGPAAGRRIGRGTARHYRSPGRTSAMEVGRFSRCGGTCARSGALNL